MMPVGILSQGGDGIGAVTSLGSLGSNIQLAAGVNTYTKNSQSIGPAATDRVVVVNVSVAAGDFLQDVACTGVTCNGQSMIAIGNTTATQAGEGTLFYLLVPTGTTADFVFTFAPNTDVRAAQIWGYRVNGYSGRAPAVIDANTNPSAPNVIVQLGDSVISGAAANRSTSSTFNTSSMSASTINANAARAVSGSARYDVLLSALISNSAGTTVRLTPNLSADERGYYAIWRHQ